MKIELWSQIDWRAFGLGFVLRVDFRWKSAEARLLVGPILVKIAMAARS
jgi:hypothetical protein